MEGVEQVPRLTDERIVSSSDELRMKLYLRLIYSFLCTPPRTVVLREMALKYLGLDLSMTYDGITPLKFISKDSLLNLKDACDTRKIEDFLQCLFVESGIVDVLGRGEVKFKMFIYKMSREEYECYSQIKGRSTEEREDEEQKMLSLFVEELDPNLLFKDLRNMHLVGENDRKQVMNCIPRKQRNEFLIGRLCVLKRNEMFKILLVHCMKHDNELLKKKINHIYGGNTGNSHFTGKRVEDESLPGQKLFTADFTLSVQESTDTLKVDIQNRKWYLDTVETVKKEIVIMGLAPDWEPTKEKAITTVSSKKFCASEEFGSIRTSQSTTRVDDRKLHQNILIRCLPVLVRDLDVTAVCMYILQRGVLDDVTVRDILEQKTTSDKTRELIKQIQQRDHDTYEKFKECLVQAKQECLKVMLEEEEAEFAKEIEAAPRSTIPESDDAVEKSQQSILTIDLNRLESSEVDQIDSKPGSDSCNSSNISHDDHAHVAGIGTDTSLNDQDGVIYQRQQPAGNRSDFSGSGKELHASEAGSSIKPSTTSQIKKQGLKRRKKIKPNEEKQGLKRRKKIKPNEEAVKKEIVIMGLAPDWEPTEEKAITTVSEGHSTKQSQKDTLEKQVVSTVNSTKGRNRLSAQSERIFRRKFHRTYQECIVLHFEHNEGDSEDLKRVCCTERNIKECVQSVFEGTGIENMMGEGEFKLSMLLMQVKQPNSESLARVLDPLNGSSKDDIFKIFVEELDPRRLCKDLKQEGVLDESDEAEMLGKTSRMDRMLFLMDKLTHKPDGYKVLMEHCMMYNKYVIQKLEENEIMTSVRNHMNNVSTQADAQSSSSDSEVLYTVTVVMKIKAKEQTTYRKSKTKQQTMYRGSMTSEKYEITCSHLLDPVYYFDDVLKNRTATPQKDLFMVLQRPFEEEGNMSFFKTEKRHLKRKRSMHSDDAASSMLS